MPYRYVKAQTVRSVAYHIWHFSDRANRNCRIRGPALGRLKKVSKMLVILVTGTIGTLKLLVAFSFELVILFKKKVMNLFIFSACSDFNFNERLYMIVHCSCVCISEREKTFRLLTLWPSDCSPERLECLRLFMTHSIFYYRGPLLLCCAPPAGRDPQFSNPGLG